MFVLGSSLGCPGPSKSSSRAGESLIFMFFQFQLSTRTFGSTWSVLGASWAQLGASWTPSGSTWTLLGRFWVSPELTWAPRGFKTASKWARKCSPSGFQAPFGVHLALQACLQAWPACFACPALLIELPKLLPVKAKLHFDST